MMRLRLPLAPSAIRSAARAVTNTAQSSPSSSGAASSVEAVAWPAVSYTTGQLTSAAPGSVLGGRVQLLDTARSLNSVKQDWRARSYSTSAEIASDPIHAPPVELPVAAPDAPVAAPDATAPSAAVAAPAAQPQQEEELDVEELAEKIANCSPLEIMDRALGMYGNDIAIAFSGAEDVALIEIAHLSARPYRVFCLDTGRLNSETYKFYTEVERHYNIQIEYVFPDATEVEKLTKDKGLFSFYQDGHQECCSIRKVKPLMKKLKGLRAWITGQRRDQSPISRGKLPIVQIDPSFEGRDGPETLLKWNPIATMTSEDVWRFLTNMNVPVNELHTKGYASIGCEPCTRSILPWQHEREGRWWWEESTAKETGIHKGNMDTVRPFRRSAEFGGDLYSNPAIIKFSREEMRALGKTTTRDKSGIVCLYAPWCPHCQAMDAAYKELATRLEGSGVYIAKFRADGVNKMMCQQELMMTTFPTVLFFPKNSTKIIKYPSERRDINSLHAFVSAFK